MSQSLNVNDIVNIHTDEGVRAAIVVLVARKYTHMIWADDSRPGVQIRKILNEEIRADVIDYSLAKAKKSFRRMGRTFGITKSAKRALRA